MIRFFPIAPLLALLLTLTPAAEPGRVETFAEPEPEVEPEAGGPVAAVPAFVPEAPAAPRSPGATQPVAVAPAARGLGLSDMLLVSGVMSLLSFLLAVFLTLGVLLAVNRTLSYAPLQQVSGMELQVEQLREQADALQTEAAGLRTRLDNLEALSGRMSTLENESRTLQDTIDDFRERVNDVGSQADRITTTLESLTQENATFQRFIDGLRNLLNQPEPSGEEVP